MRFRALPRPIRIVSIFGVGSVGAGVPSHVYSGGYLDREDLGLS
mgnify:CR=1 FL=1